MYSLLIGDSFEVAYDPDCLDYVYLYQDNEPVLDEQGEPVMAVTKELMPMAAYDYEEGSRTKINKLQKVRDHLVEDIELQAAELRRVAEDNISLGVRAVFKEELNTAETEFKRFRMDVEGVDYSSIFENEYLDQE